MMLKAIGIASGEDKDRIMSEWKKTGDLGTVSYNLIKNKKTSYSSQPRFNVK